MCIEKNVNITSKASIETGKDSSSMTVRAGAARRIVATKYRGDRSIQAFDRNDVRRLGPRFWPYGDDLQYRNSPRNRKQPAIKRFTLMFGEILAMNFRSFFYNETDRPGAWVRILS